MLRWSLKSLLLEPLRLFASVVGVASAFVLVIFFGAVFEGESRQIVAYPEHTDADVWVMQEGVSNMHMASSLLWDWKQTRIAALPGVMQVSSILYMNTVMSAGGRGWFSYIVGLDQNTQSGGPWLMAAGTPRPGPGEAVIPDVIAALTGLGIGDNISITDREFQITGLSRGTFSMANSVTFVTKQDLGKLMRAGDAVSYILVKAASGVVADELAETIEAEVPKVSALARADFIARDREMALQMGTEIIRIMTLIGMALALLIVAYTAYSNTVRRQRELAVAKALGFPLIQIYGSALYQSVVITTLGLLFAAVMAYTLLPLVPVLAPQISLVVRADAFVPLGVVAFAVAVLASLGPARRIATVDPLLVFQG